MGKAAPFAVGGKKSALTALALGFALVLTLTACGAAGAPSAGQGDEAAGTGSAGEESTEALPAPEVSTDPAESESTDALPVPEVSTDPADHGITAAMLDMTQEVSFDTLSLEAVGAFYLHTDGAGAEGASDELCRRFVSAPDAVLDYLCRLNDETAAADGDTAALCRAIACAAAFWYDGGEEGGSDFTSLLGECRGRRTDERSAALLDRLEEEYSAALKG